MQDQRIRRDGPADDTVLDPPVLSYARRLPRQKPRTWPACLAVGAASPHIMLILAGGLDLAGGEQIALATLAFLAFAIIFPLSILCSLAGIVLFPWHGNGWVLVVSVLAILSLIPLGLMILCAGV